MAKILKRNCIHVPRYKLVCRKCGTLSLFNKHELRFFEGMDDEELVSYDCPYCGKETTILEASLPKPCDDVEFEELEKNKVSDWLHNLRIKHDK